MSIQRERDRHMAEQILIQFRADRELKDDVTELLESLGLDLPTALRMFLVRTRLERGLPFSVKLTEEDCLPARGASAFAALRKQAASFPEMSLDEINEEISAARAERAGRA